MTTDDGPFGLRDPRAIRALAHPLRLRLLEHLAVVGSLTATQASELLGESPASCSFHLRQLARYGFVEEADTGHGRARPWRVKRAGLTIDEDAEDPAQALAASALAHVLDDHWLARARDWRTARAHYPAEWRKALSQSQHLLWLTPTEAASVLEEVNALIASRFRDRLGDPALRPKDALPIEILIRSHPLDVHGHDQ